MFVKGCALLLTLEALVGRSRLDTFITEYFAHFSFQAMSTDVFVAYLRATLLAEQPGLEAQLQLAAWVDGPGLPANAPAPTSRRFAAVDHLLAQLATGTAPAAFAPDTATWSSHEWVHFLHGLPVSLTAEQLAKLDAAFHFTESGNAEILTAWFPHTLRAGYEPGDVATDKFLRHVGRRKFLVPLYRVLLATPNGLARARAIYQEARPNYQSVAIGTLNALLTAPLLRG